MGEIITEHLGNRFSLYLTINDRYLHEIEALLLRIASPPGAKQRGKLAQSKDMRRRIAKDIRTKSHEETAALLGRKLTPSKASGYGVPESDLLRLLPHGGKIKGLNKGVNYRARVTRTGIVRYKGTSYRSLSLAAKAALQRSINGWWFWQVERSRQNWVRLNKIRKAGTPIYPS